jgi:hypothetical protein
MSPNPSHDPCPWNDEALCPDCLEAATRAEEAHREALYRLAQERLAARQALDRLEHGMLGTLPRLTRSQLAEALTSIAAELQGMVLLLSACPLEEDDDDGD